jgi:hypothetical protein
MFFYLKTLRTNVKRKKKPTVTLATVRTGKYDSTGRPYGRQGWEYSSVRANITLATVRPYQGRENSSQLRKL